jgi:transcriptional regulator with AAA-type ATPase domain
VTQTADEANERSSEGTFVSRPFLVLALNGARPRDGSARFGLDGVDEVVFGRGTSMSVTRRVASGRNTLAIEVPAASASQRHARIVLGRDGAHVEDLGSKNGTVVNGARVDRAALDDGDVVEIGGAFFVFRPRWPTLVVLEDDLGAPALEGTPRAMRTVIPGLEHRYRALLRIAASNLSVLLLGETGTGKELLARAVHEASGRRGAFVAVNCGALPASLVEALLFGHRRGAFSGAIRDERGFVRAADGGTLFLDEIGDLALPSQAVLLRVLQEREVVPIGETQPTRVDVRVVAATHRPIQTLAQAEGFRSDLLGRLAGYTFVAPSLRERKEDMGLLVADMLARLRSNAPDVTLAPAAVRALLAHAWPRNVRELEQALAASLELMDGEVLGRAHLPASIDASPAAPPPGSAPPPAPRGTKVSAAELARLMEEHEGNVAAVARALSKAPLQVRRWLKEYGLDANDYRRRPE